VIEGGEIGGVRRWGRGRVCGGGLVLLLTL